MFLSSFRHSAPRRLPVGASIAGTFAVIITACGSPQPAAAPSPMSGKRAESNGGMVVASQPDAAAAGLEVLNQGGNAIDAAVATAFALSVTDVSQTGLGGGGALTYFDAGARRASHYSFYSRSGEAPEWGTGRGGAQPGPGAQPAPAQGGRGQPAPAPGGRGQPAPAQGGRGQAGGAPPAGPGAAAATPGMVAGLVMAHERHGRLTRAQVLAPAIRLARDGFTVTPLLARTIASSAERIGADSIVRLRFIPDGEPLRPGSRLVQPELAATLERIAAEGAAGFYKGPVAERLAAKVKAAGGLITVRDMEQYPVAAMRPLCTQWRGYTVLGAPPPMGGAPTLAMLNLADAAGLADAGGLTDRPAAAVMFANVHRLATVDGSAWRGDPAALSVPARGVTHPQYAAQRARTIGTTAADTVRAGDPWPFDSATPPGACATDAYPAAVRPAAPTAPPEPASGPGAETFTSHLSVVDGAGNAVSMTTTVGVLFGSGVFTDGFFLNSSASNFDARTRGPNRYANSTIAPTMLLEGDRVRLVVGAAGSQYIQGATVQVTLRILAFGEDAGAAVAAPRLQANTNGRVVEVEPGFSSEVYAALVAAGYRPLSRVADITFGGVHAVHVRRDGKRVGAADPRRDGAARGQ